MTENKKNPQDGIDFGEFESIIVTDNEGHVVVVIDNKHIIEHEGYKVILDKKLT